MAKKDLRKESRTDWIVETDNELTVEHAQFGCLLRIADAVEIIAKNHNELIEERDRWKRRYYEMYKQFSHKESVISGYKGVVTKLKGQIKQLKGEI